MSRQINATVTAVTEAKSKNYIFLLKELEKLFDSTLTEFLKVSDQKVLILKTRDPNIGAMRVFHLLQDFPNKEKGTAQDHADDHFQKYLACENQTFIQWYDLVTILNSNRVLPNFTNLLVIELPSTLTRNAEEEGLMSKIIENLNFAVTRKVIFICSNPEIMEKYIDKYYIGLVSKLDEFERNTISWEIDRKEHNSYNLIEAVRNGCTDDVLNLLRSNANVNAFRVRDQLYILHIAAERGHRDIVVSLLENGANLEVKDKNNETALHKAAASGHNAVVICLLEHGADVNAESSHKLTPSFMAARNGHTEVVASLLKYNAQIWGQSCCFRTTALHEAAEKGHKDVVICLLDSGIKVDIESKNGITALYNAVTSGHNDVVTTLLKHKANPWFKICGKTVIALHVASQSGHKDVVVTLIKHGLDVNIKDLSGSTPLHHAAWQGHKDTVISLLELGADINAKNNFGSCPLHRTTQTDILLFLLKHGADINAMNIFGETALHNAAENDLEDVVYSLLNFGADPNVRNKYGSTPLHKASLHGNKNIVLNLIKYGAMVNAENKLHETPLHWTIIGQENYSSRKLVILALLENGAFISSKSEDSDKAKKKVEFFKKAK